MTREWDIFLEALKRFSTEARAAFVERATGGDPKRSEAVEALIENNQADTFLEQGPAELLRESMEAKGHLTLKEEQFEAERQNDRRSRSWIMCIGKHTPVPQDTHWRGGNPL